MRTDSAAMVLRANRQRDDNEIDISEYAKHYVSQPENIADLIVQRACEHGTKIAFRYREGRNNLDQKTFDEVHADVCRLASWLGEQYARSTHFAIIGPNSYEWVITFMAITSSGNVAVPIDKDLRTDEVAARVLQSDAKVIFCSKGYLDLVDGAEGADVFGLEDVFELEPRLVLALQPSEIDSSDLASIFFTSGTSGGSKAVMLSQGNIMAEINSTCMMYCLQDNTLAVLPFHHVLGFVAAVLMVFNYGQENFINKSLKNIGKDLIEAKPRMMFLTPIFLETFRRQIIDGVNKAGKESAFKRTMAISDLLLRFGIDLRNALFRGVMKSFGGNWHDVISGGGPLDPALVKFFRSLGVEVLNGYGMTETSSAISCNTMRHHKDGSVGLLVPGSAVEVLDDGELAFTGPLVMMGYYGDSVADDEAFCDGWYRSGDLGYVDEQGYLFLTGRKKNLIILSNGENVSPEELEGEIARDPAVRDVVVQELSGRIVAEIFPYEEFGQATEYFDDLIARVNEGRPAYRQISKVNLRDHDFVRNSAHKIIRSKNATGEQN